MSTYDAVIGSAAPYCPCGSRACNAALPLAEVMGEFAAPDGTQHDASAKGPDLGNMRRCCKLAYLSAGSAIDPHMCTEPQVPKFTGAAAQIYATYLAAREAKPPPE